jgi:H+/gluconate symporter-like permease
MSLIDHGKRSASAAGHSRQQPVVLALAAAIPTVIIVNYRRQSARRQTMDARAHSYAVPILMIVSLVGFGAVIGARSAFAVVREGIRIEPINKA